MNIKEMLGMRFSEEKSSLFDKTTKADIKAVLLEEGYALTNAKDELERIKLDLGDRNSNENTLKIMFGSFLGYDCDLSKGYNQKKLSFCDLDLMTLAAQVMSIADKAKFEAPCTKIKDC